MWRIIIVIISGAGFALVQAAFESSDRPHQASFRRGGFHHKLAAINKQATRAECYRTPKQISLSPYSLIGVSDDDSGTDTKLDNFDRYENSDFGEYDQFPRVDFLGIGSLSQPNPSTFGLGYYAAGTVADTFESSNKPEVDLSGQTRETCANEGSFDAHPYHDSLQADSMSDEARSDRGSLQVDSSDEAPSGRGSLQVDSSDEASSGRGSLHGDSTSDDFQNHSCESVLSESGFLSRESQSDEFAVDPDRCPESGGGVLSSNAPFGATTALNQNRLDCRLSTPGFQDDCCPAIDDQNLVLETDKQSALHNSNSAVQSTPPLFDGDNSGDAASDDAVSSIESVSDSFLPSSRLQDSVAGNELCYRQFDRTAVSSQQLPDRNDRLSKLTYQSFFESVLRSHFNLRPTIGIQLDIHEGSDASHADCSAMCEPQYDQFGILSRSTSPDRVPPLIDSELCLPGSKSSDIRRYDHEKSHDRIELVSVVNQEEDDRFGRNEEEYEIAMQKEYYLSENPQKEYWSDRPEDEYQSERPQDEHRSESHEEEDWSERQEEGYRSERQQDEYRSEKRSFSLYHVQTLSENNQLEQDSIASELQPVLDLSTESSSNNHSKIAFFAALFVFLACISGIVLKARIQHRSPMDSWSHEAPRQAWPLSIDYHKPVLAIY